MKILILDTSTNVFSVALSSAARVLAEECGDAGPQNSALIPGRIQSMFVRCGLQPADLDAIAVTVGPGSFTGVRVGISLAKGLAYATGKPIIPLSSLHLLALNDLDSQVAVCPMFDARKGEVYAALFSFTGHAGLILPETVASPAGFLQTVAGDALFIGDGAVKYRDLIVSMLGNRASFAADCHNQPNASRGSALALDLLQKGHAVTPAELLPVYLRLSEAELSRKSLIN